MINSFNPAKRWVYFWKNEFDLKINEVPKCVKKNMWW